MSEIFRDIPGWPRYRVSDLGHVISLKRGRPRGIMVDIYRGYHRVKLCLGDGYPHRKGIHQLVALAFIGPLPEGMEVRHLDGNRANNVPSNLAYGTSSQNNLDKVVHGTHNMARKTHCPKGHEYSEANTYRFRLKTGSLTRQCRTCNRHHAMLRARRIRAAA